MDAPHGPFRDLKCKGRRRSTKMKSMKEVGLRGRREQYLPEPLNYEISRKVKASREQYLPKPLNYAINHKMKALNPTEHWAQEHNLGEELGRPTEGVMTDDTSSFQQLYLVVALAKANSVMGFDRPWPIDTEPVWWQNLLEEGFEMQRTGFCMWTLADRVEEQARARMDERYSIGIANWIDGWRMRWDEESQVGRAVRWGPINEQEYEEYVLHAENVLRKKWLEHTFPVACNNWALERYFAEFGLHGTPDGEHRRAREEEEEARNTRLSRSRTPQRRGQPSASSSRDATRGLLNRRNMEETEEMALVVKKFLLKKKDAKSFRRLVDNPEAWRSGPGVTVTTSTRGTEGVAATVGEGYEQRTETEAGSRRQGVWQCGNCGADRTMLRLDTDSDFEDETPMHMPGFLNEPTYSTVYETLQDKTPAEFQTMAAALSNFVGLVHSDLQAIVARVGHERGLPVSGPTEDTEEGTEARSTAEEADTSTGAACAPSTEPQEIEAEEIEVEIDEDEETLLMQTQAEAKARASGTPKNEAHRRLLQLRDWLEARWAEGHHVDDMVQAAMDHSQSLLRGSSDCARGREWFGLVQVVVPPIAHRGQGKVQWQWLTPCQREWVQDVGNEILQLIQAEKEEERASLMQRTLTKMTKESSANPPIAANLHAELQRMPEQFAQKAARELLSRLRAASMTGADWGQIEAVLVAHSLIEVDEASGPTCALNLREWTNQWYQEVLSRRPASGNGASSSHEAVPVQPQAEAGQDPEVEARASEEEAQARADEELYKWHVRSAAREARREDRAAVLAHMGWSVTRTRRQWMDVVLHNGREEHKITVPVQDKETLKLQITPYETVGVEYRYQGVLQDPEVARRQLQNNMEEQYKQEVEREESSAKRRRGFNTEDPDIQPHYHMWEQGQLTWRELVDRVGEDAASFIKAAAEVDLKDLETQVEVAPTQLYEAEGHGHHAAGGNPDEAETLLLEGQWGESDASTVEMDGAGDVAESRERGRDMPAPRE
ncbi:unnamed protein product [Symbiodinium necroappetens]|uniref:Uncharacterized protein n=1 Tax=Symbiodinium necroappetens TaxID=1628268 RepID=A0A813AKP9_9DINO|nr:unnamed protein product [Symbiodinium necroappetens]